MAKVDARRSLSTRRLMSLTQSIVVVVVVVVVAFVVVVPATSAELSAPTGR